jgi:hypothetical protein
METKIYNIDCMKHRKSTHLASVDVEAIIAEKGKCILTIKEAYYSPISDDPNTGKKIGINVNGKLQDGYFLEFVEDVKPMVVNSGNRKTIAKMVQLSKGIVAVESRNLMSWNGFKIELLFDPNIKFGKETTGGIVVSPIAPIIEKKKPTFKEEHFEKAFNANATIETITNGFITNEEILTKYNQYVTDRATK